MATTITIDDPIIQTIVVNFGPAGTNGTNMVFDIKTIFGQVIRLHPTSNDKIRGVVSDDIDATEGMAKMTASFIGSYTEGEA